MSPIQLEGKTKDLVNVKEQQFNVDEVGYILMVTRMQELEARVDQLEDVEEELQARVDDLEDVEEKLEGTIDSLQTKATQAGQEAAWRKEKQKLQDENSTVQMDVDKKNAENQRQQKDHRRKEDVWRQDEKSLQFKIDNLEDQVKRESSEQSKLETKYAKSEREVTGLKEVVSARESMLKGQKTAHAERIESIEQEHKRSDQHHEQELTRANENAEKERLRADEFEENHKSLLRARQELQVSHDEKAVELEELSSQVGPLRQALESSQHQIQERDTTIEQHNQQPRRHPH